MAAKKTTKKTVEGEEPKKKITSKNAAATVDNTPEEVETPSPETEEIENPSTDAIMQSPNDAELVFNEKAEIAPKESVVESEECEKIITDDQEAEACTPEVNQEIETPEPVFKEDEDMVNDITNLLNGLDGISSWKKSQDSTTPGEGGKDKKDTKRPVNTEEKNIYSEQFSRSWGGVIYDI